MTKELKATEPLVLRCALNDVLMMRCECERIGREDEEHGPYELKYTTSVAETRFVGSGLWADVTAEIVSHSDSGKQIFQVLAVFRLNYHISGPPPSDQELREFEASTPVFQAWPYIREIVQNLTSRMQFNPPPLPLIKRKPADVALKPKVKKKLK